MRDTSNIGFPEEEYELDLTSGSDQIGKTKDELLALVRSEPKQRSLHTELITTLPRLQLRGTVGPEWAEVIDRLGPPSS